MNDIMISDIILYLSLGWLGLISLVSVVVTVADKLKAVRHNWRIKESTLLILSALGGSVAMLITMLLIRHKTRKLKFMLGIPIIIILQLALVAGIYMVNQNALF